MSIARLRLQHVRRSPRLANDPREAPGEECGGPDRPGDATASPEACGGRDDRRWRGVAWAAAAVFALLALHAAWLETPTVDEFAHVPAGLAYLEHGKFEFYAKNPPLFPLLMALPASLGGPQVPRPEGPEQLSQGWGPWIYGAAFMRANPDRYLRTFFRARWLPVLAAMLTALVLHAWARSLFGERAAALASAFFLLSPAVLAHGHLATVDAACMASIFGCFWLARCGARGDGSEPTRWGAWAGVGAAWGVALLVKFTALLLLPAFALAIGWHRRRAPARAAAEVAALLVAALVVVNAGMMGQGSGTPLDEYRFISRTCQTLQARLPGGLPVPLPRAYVLGFDAVRRDTEQGEFGSYLMGRWTQRGQLHHDAVAFAVKTPLPTLLLLAATPWALRRRRLPGPEWLWIATPLLVLGLSLALLNQVKTGSRYLLPLEPLLALLSAAVWWSPQSRWTRRQAAAAALCGALLLGSALARHPEHLAFFNRLAGGREGGHRFLVRSDLDWGQDLYRLPEALAALGRTRDEPLPLLYFGHVDPRFYGVDYRIPPPGPLDDIVAVSVSYLVGLSYPVTLPTGELAWVNLRRLAWLRGREPRLRLGSLWIYDGRAPPLSAPGSSPHRASP